MIDWKNILERAAWTFLEVFLVSLPDPISTSLFDGDMWKAALFSAGCAAASAVKTLIIEWIQNRKKSWIPPVED